MTLPQPASTRWQNLLLRIQAADSSFERSRLTVELLGEPGARDFLLSHVTSPDLGPIVWTVAFHEVRNLARRGENWVPRALEWVDRIAPTWQRSARFCDDLAQEARLLNSSALLHVRPERLQDEDPREPRGRGLYHVYLASLRRDSRFRQIERVLEGGRVRVAQLDPYCQALYAFALLGQNRPEGIAYLERALEVGENDRKVLRVLLHGLGSATRLPDQAERILALLNETGLGSETYAMPQYYRAVALRSLGDYDQAMEAVDQGLLFLGPDEFELHADLLRERGLILAERDQTARLQAQFEAYRERSRAEFDEAARAAATQFEQHMRSLSTQVSDNLFRIVEILGVFTAVIALVVGGVVSVTGGGLVWWQRALLIVTTGGVTLGFFWLLRLIVRPSRPR
jgi:tetratricopeptide (TPR) repeat protein